MYHVIFTLSPQTDYIYNYHKLYKVTQSNYYPDNIGNFNISQDNESILSLVNDYIRLLV